MSKEVIDKLFCHDCLKYKSASRGFYSTSNPYHKTGKTAICKDCLIDNNEAPDGNYDMDKIAEMLRTIDKPLLIDLWINSKEEAEKRNSTQLKIYMKNIAMVNFVHMNWNDTTLKSKNGKFLGEETESVEFIIYTPELEDDGDLELTEPQRKRLIRTWNQSYKDTEFLFLEDFFGGLIKNYPTEDPIKITAYKDLAKMALQADEELKNKNTKMFKELIDLSSKIQKAHGLNGLLGDNKIVTLGTMIADIEIDEPAEYVEMRPQFEDVDQFGKYIEDWIVRPFKNIFDISRDFMGM